MNELFEINTPDFSLSNPFRPNFQLRQPKFSTKTFGYRSFSYCRSKSRNALPVDVKNAQSLPIFKSRITKWCHSANFDNLIVN